MANIKISELNELETKHRNDLLPIVNSYNNETEKIKVENLINENVELIAVSSTAPSECSLGDKYFNTTVNKLYTAIATNTWSSTGENAVEGILYIVFNEQSTYAYNGTTLVSVGGGSGSSDIVIIGDESETTEDTKLLVDTSGTTDTLKYKDNNSFTELQIKALDSMPVGTEVDFDGQVSDIPVGWEQVSGKSYVAYELWTNSSPTSSFGNTILNIDTTDIDFIEVYYLRYSLDTRILYQKIINGSYKQSEMSYSDYDSGNSRSWNRKIDWNNTSFEFGQNYINGSVENRGLIPYKIIGYKEV